MIYGSVNAMIHVSFLAQHIIVAMKNSHDHLKPKSQVPTHFFRSQTDVIILHIILKDLLQSHSDSIAANSGT